MPGNGYNGKLLDYVDSIPFADVRDTSNWLRANAAAWLFRDGYYLVSPMPNTLAAYTLDGIMRWRAKFDPTNGSVQFAQQSLGSSYRISDDAWERVRQAEERREKLFSQLG